METRNPPAAATADGPVFNSENLEDHAVEYVARNKYPSKRGNNFAAPTRGHLAQRRKEIDLRLDALDELPSLAFAKSYGFLFANSVAFYEGGKCARPDRQRWAFWPHLALDHAAGPGTAMGRLIQRDHAKHGRRQKVLDAIKQGLARGWRWTQTKGRFVTAQKAGADLQVTGAIAQLHRFRTLAPIDATPADREAFRQVARREQDRIRKANKRREDGRPTLAERHLTSARKMASLFGVAECTIFDWRKKGYPTLASAEEALRNGDDAALERAVRQHWETARKPKKTAAFEAMAEDQKANPRVASAHSREPAIAMSDAQAAESGDLPEDHAVDPGLGPMRLQAMRLAPNGPPPRASAHSHSKGGSRESRELSGKAYWRAIAPGRNRIPQVIRETLAPRHLRFPKGVHDGSPLPPDYARLARILAAPAGYEALPPECWPHVEISIHQRKA